MVELFDVVNFDEDETTRYSKLDQLLDEGIFPMEAIVDFMEVCHYPRNNPIPVPNNIFRNKKTENELIRVEVDPILKVMGDYTLIRAILKNEI